MSVGQDPLYGPAGRRCILFSAQGHKKPAIRQSICSGLVKTFQNACQQLSGPNVFPMAGIDDDFRIEDTLLLGVLCMAVCNLLSSLPILHQTADPVQQVKEVRET